MVGWVFFRAGTIDEAFQYLRSMVGLNDGDPLLHGLYGNLTPQVAIALVAGIVLSTDIVERIQGYIARHSWGETSRQAGLAVGHVLLISLALVVTVRIMAGTYNPFIYFRF